MSTLSSHDPVVAFSVPMTGLADFRRWAQSDDFPAQGRIDYLAGRIEIDMSPEDLFTHGTLKTEIVAVLHQLTKREQLGWLCTDSTRVSNAAADLSAEPDAVFISRAAVIDGRVRLVPKSSREPDRYTEVEGSPDLVVEIVSDSSVRKDQAMLPKLYFAAGVREYWLIDARSAELRFTILKRGLTEFVAAPLDDDGFSESLVLKRAFRLTRTKDDLGHWTYDLSVRSV